MELASAMNLVIKLRPVVHPVSLYARQRHGIRTGEEIDDKIANAEKSMSLCEYFVVGALETMEADNRKKNSVVSIRPSVHVARPLHVRL